MVPVDLLFSTEHLKEKYWLFLKNKELRRRRRWWYCCW